MEDNPGQGLLGWFKALVRKKSHLGDSNDLTEEIHGLMDEGHAKGLVSDEETDMVFGVLDLKQTQAHSVMIPRTEISSAPADATLGEIIKLVTDCGHTRIPIHNENIDEVIGILHAKDLLKLWGEDTEFVLPSDILQDPFFVPENLKLTDLLRNMKEMKTHMALVTDEYGGTAGIVTIEDILEEIVGDIMDEHDTDVALLTELDNGSILVDAKLEAEKLKEHLGLQFPDGDFESVGGFIIHLLGRIPLTDEKFPFQEFEITIQKADQRKIDKILIERKPPSPESPL
ncbi:MAG: hemolysin family protein [Desulfatiglandaceae bacterium]